MHFRNDPRVRGGEVADIRQDAFRLGGLPRADEEAGGFWEEEERGSKEDCSRDELHAKGHHPLRGSRGVVALHAVVDPKAKHGGDLEGDIVDANEEAADAGGRDFRNVPFFREKHHSEGGAGAGEEGVIFRKKLVQDMDYI